MNKYSIFLSIYANKRNIKFSILERCFFLKNQSSLNTITAYLLKNICKLQIWKGRKEVVGYGEDGAVVGTVEGLFVLQEEKNT